MVFTEDSFPFTGKSNILQEQILLYFLCHREFMRFLRIVIFEKV